VETYDFRKAVPPKLFSIMKQAHKRSSLMATQIDALPHQIEAVLDNGLIIGHAYSITGIQELTIQGQKVNLVRIRNPWGNQYEWKGAWGDSSPELKTLSPAQKKEMGLSLEDDGEFWMEFNDFTRNFQKWRSAICHQIASRVRKISITGRQYVTKGHGRHESTLVDAETSWTHSGPIHNSVPK